MYNIKKVTSIYLKNSIREEKKFEEEKKFGNIIKEKKWKGKKLVAGVLGAALLCWSASFGQSLYQNNTKTSKNINLK